MDQFYFESGYIDDKYFTAEYYAEASLDAQSSVDCSISHLYGVDISAFSDAALTADAVVLREVSASLDSSSLVEAQALLIADRDSTISSEFAQTTLADRIRDEIVSITTDFAFDITVEIITPTGEIKEFAAAFASAFEQAQTVELYKEYTAGLEVVSTISETYDRIRDTGSLLETQVTQEVVTGRIVQGACDFSSLFTPSASIDGVKNTFAILDSTSALATVAIANRSADIALSSIVNQSLQADRIRDYAAQIQSTTTLACSPIRIKQFNAGISTAFATACVIKKTVRYTSALSSQFTVALTANKRSTYWLVEKENILNLSYQSITTDTQGNVYALGRNSDGITANVNIYLVKFNSMGVKQWHKRILLTDSSSNAYQYGNQVIICDGTDVYLAIGNYYPATNSQRVNLLKVSNSGSLVWNKNISNVNGLFTAKIKNNDLYLVGNSYTNFTSYAYDTIVKFNLTTLTVTQTKRFYHDQIGEFGRLDIKGIDIDSSGNVYLSAQNFETQALVIKLSSAFNVTWYKSLNNTNWYPTDLVLDTDENVYIASSKVYLDGSAFKYKPNVTKFDATGNIVWSKTVDKTFGQHTYGIAHNNGSIYLTHSDQTAVSGVERAVFTMGMSSTGSILFQNKLKSNITNQNIFNNENWPRLITHTANENIYFVASRDLDNDLDTDRIVLAKFPPNNTKLGEYDQYLYESTALSLIDETTSTTNGTLLTSAITVSANDAIYYSFANSGFNTPDPVVYLFILGSARITANAALTAIISRQFSGLADVQGTFVQTARPLRIKQLAANLTVTANSTTSAKRLRGVIATLSVEAQTQATGIRYQRFQALIQCSATQQTDPQYYSGTGINIQCQFATNISLGLIKRTPIALQAFNTQVSSVVKIGRGLIGLDVNLSVQANVVKNTNTSANSNLITNQNTLVVKTARTPVDINCSTTIDIEIGRFKEFAADLTAMSAQADILIERVRPAIITAQVTVTQTTQAYDFTKTDAVLISTFDNDVTANSTKPFTVGLTANFNEQLGTGVTRIRPFSSALAVNASMDPNPYSVVRPTLIFESIAVQMVIGDVIAFDQELMLRIPYEYRTLQIPEEHLLLMVPEETRVNMVRKIAQ